MSEKALRYAVVIASPGHWKPPEVARVLAGLRKQPVADVVLSVRKSWGILSQDLDEPAARAMAAALGEAGLKALAVPDGLLEEPPPASPVSGMGFSAQGLFPETEPGSPGKAPRNKEDASAVPGSFPYGQVSWNDVVILAAAGFKERTVRKVKVEEGPGLGRKALNIGIALATGLPGGFGGGKKEVEKTVESSDLVFYLDLILKGPAGRLRIDAQDFDYSCLGAKKSFSTVVNFGQLVSDLADGAPLARRNWGAQVLLEGRAVREMGYESLEDLERECRWLLTLQALHH